MEMLPWRGCHAIRPAERDHFLPLGLVFPAMSLMSMGGPECGSVPPSMSDYRRRAFFAFTGQDLS